MMYGFYILLFAFGLAFFLAFFLIIFVLIPLTVYSVPYALWLGSQQQKGKYSHIKINSFRFVIDATKVYKSWITHTKPQI